ncbi:PadR family transcriptional regulator [Microaceticoccus formicicus]|uniref:PadR family transcriptional regulator n=1 Tax=Microaceticoccus formicicus TaxID=3118105 RepID=UPI003CD020B6|nr:PadR family transcriptional regulator [Peptoniphilaceae bacterium AMB_02]
MKMVIESPLTETVFLILLSMTEPNHGYGVMQYVEEATEGRVVFGPGTLYGAINTLAKKGWIKRVDEVDRRKEYQITEKGMANLQFEIKRMQDVLRIAKHKGVIVNEKI